VTTWMLGFAALSTNLRRPTEINDDRSGWENRINGREMKR